MNTGMNFLAVYAVFVWKSTVDLQPNPYYNRTVRRCVMDEHKPIPLSEFTVHITENGKPCENKEDNQPNNDDQQ